MEPADTMPALNNGRALLDEVMYLASLASDPTVIDPIMESVRTITAKLQLQSSALSDQDQIGLQHVRSELKQHLMHDDKLRSFTEGELDRQVAEAMGAAGQRHESLWMIARVIVLAIAVYPLGALITTRAQLPDPLALASAFSTTTLYVGLIWLYVSALGTFTPQLQVAYRWLCLNMLALCAAAVASTILNGFPSASHIALMSYGSAVMYLGLLSALIGYQGMRRFARAIELRSLVSSWPLMLFGGLVLGGLFGLLPHAAAPDEAAFHISVALWTLVGSFSLAVAVLGLSVAKHVTSKYAQAINWFSVAYVQAAVISVGVLIRIFVSGPIYAGLPLLVIELAMATCGFSLVIAGYKFLRSVGKT